MKAPFHYAPILRRNIFFDRALRSLLLLLPLGEGWGEGFPIPLFRRGFPLPVPSPQPSPTSGRGSKYTHHTMRACARHSRVNRPGHSPNFKLNMSQAHARRAQSAIKKGARP